MGGTPIAAPPAILAARKWPTTLLAPEKLYRISSYPTGEPYFGNSGGNRFDAPGCISNSPEYGACYLGYSLEVALAESVLHDEIPVDGKFLIAKTSLSNRYVYRFFGDTLRVLNLTGPLLKKLSGHADLIATSDYAIPQQWALAVFRNPVGYDGFTYASRHVTLGKAVILFDRAKDKIRHHHRTPLNLAPGYARAAKKFSIVGI